VPITCVVPAVNDVPGLAGGVRSKYTYLPPPPRAAVSIVSKEASVTVEETIGLPALSVTAPIRLIFARLPSTGVFVLFASSVNTILFVPEGLRYEKEVVLNTENQPSGLRIWYRITGGASPDIKISLSAPTSKEIDSPAFM
jgi:hypothetical protein